jgi:hypothetical protein
VSKYFHLCDACFPAGEWCYANSPMHLDDCAVCGVKLTPKTGDYMVNFDVYDMAFAEHDDKNHPGHACAHFARRYLRESL